MLFDSQWSGDAIAAPVWVTNDREDETPPCIDDGSWSRTDIRPHQSREELDRRDSAKSPHRHRWISLPTLILGKLRSRNHRRREIRRMNAVWSMMTER